MPDQLSFLLIMAATHGLYAQSFIRELKAQGHRVVVVTRADALSYDWPREDIDALYAVNDIFDAAEVRNAISYLARSERIDRLVGPGEYDIELAASLREHLRVGGMGETRATSATSWPCASAPAPTASACRPSSARSTTPRSPASSRKCPAPGC
jgi:hypothetical protein